MEFYPIFCTHVAVAGARGTSFMQLGNRFGMAFEGHAGKVIHVKHTEHMVADVEYENRAESRCEFAEGGFLCHPIKGQAIVSESLNIHCQPSLKTIR